MLAKEEKCKSVNVVKIEMNNMIDSLVSVLWNLC